MKESSPLTNAQTLTVEEISTAPRARWMRTADGKEALRFVLPDRASCIGQEQLLEQSGSRSRKLSREPSCVRMYGGHGRALDDPQLANSPLLITIDDERFFSQARIPLADGHSQLIIWVAVELSYALRLLKALESDASPTDLAQVFADRRQIASIANILAGDDGAFGLFSLAQIELDGVSPVPIVRAVDDQYTPFPGLDPFLGLESAAQQKALNQVAGRAAAETEWEYLFEDAIVRHDFQAAAEMLHAHRVAWMLSPRAQFAAGCLYLKFNDFQTALEHFHQAQLLDHPAGLRGEWTCQHGLAAPMRKAHPDVFAAIQRGDRLQVLTQLRAIASQFPLAGPAILSYCLRRAGVPEEGLNASMQALQIDRNQSDVLSNTWRYLVDLRRDDEALEIAREHVLRFPQEQSATKHLIDSLLLCARADEAELLAERYAIFSTNAGMTAKQFFRVYETLEAWDDLLLRFRELLAFIPRPSTATLAAYGEILTETGNFDESYEVFEKALTSDPGNGKVILGYARSLARSEKEVEAECLLQTALMDRNRVDCYEDRIFLLTLLAEIQRRTGREKEALQSFNEFLPEDIAHVCRKAGPLPGVELAEVYLANQQRDAAKRLAQALTGLFPGDPFVSEIAEAAA
ncbi:MAG: hypothetical protein U0136_08020 [Bdellovibrionota bacterium]